MDFAQQQRNPSKHLIGFTIVVLLHVLIVYALVTGLARKVIEVVKAPIETKIIEEVKKLPPPPDIPLPPPPTLEAPPPPPYVPPPEIQIQAPPSVNAITVQSTTPPPQQQDIRPSPSPPATPAPAQSAPVQIAVVCPTQPKPALPRKALQEGISGTVIAKATIRGGRVVNVEIVRSSPRGVFDAAVRTAMANYQCNASDQDIVALQEFEFKIE